ncbi:DUF2436 domain-containing protein [Prevotella falsenii]|uniref:DUF2436 domain-containing protein n=1 Tax=Prevotella falsenii TaxID=515414 RepID=UPI00068890A8|nr:DUF2436 domain-containing protein [Prevotella falsenii]
MKTNLFKNTYAAIAALFIAMLALPTAVHAQGKARIILEAHNVWGDGSGYQMLLDADHNLYGDKFSAEGPLWNDNNPPADLYNGFEYKIPGNADPSTTPQHMIVDGEGYVDIPAGIYDFCIAAPQANAKIWIAGNYDGPTRADDYKFEAGKTYRFTMHMTEGGSNDAAKLTITNSGEVQTYGLKIAGTEVTSDNCNDLSVISGVSGTVKYDPSTNTLTLDNATINTTANNIHGIYVTSPLTIKVKGTVNIKAADANSLFIFATSAVSTITGTGTLNLEGWNGLEGQRVVIENITLNAKGEYGGIIASSSYANSTFEIRNANITAEGNRKVPLSI